MGLFHPQTDPGTIPNHPPPSTQNRRAIQILPRPHPSGLPAASPDYDPLKLRTPWFHAGPQSTRAPDARAPSLFDTAGHSERYHFQIDDVHHVDPTSYARVEGRKEREGYWPAFDLGSLERNDLLSRYVLEFFAAFLMTRPESIAFLEHAPQQTLEHRTATTPPVTYEQFVDALLNGDAGNAIDEVRELQRSWPEHMLLNDFYLYRLAYSLLYSWGLREESLQLAMLNQELNLRARYANAQHELRGAWGLRRSHRSLPKASRAEARRRRYHWYLGVAPGTKGASAKQGLIAPSYGSAMNQNAARVAAVLKIRADSTPAFTGIRHRGPHVLTA